MNSKNKCSFCWPIPLFGWVAWEEKRIKKGFCVGLLLRIMGGWLYAVQIFKADSFKFAPMPNNSTHFDFCTSACIA